jgi:hypothetical protein
MADPECISGGWIVGMDERLPASPREYYSQKGLVVGCNRIKCNKCGEWVRWFDQVAFDTATLDESECEWLFRSKSLPKRDYIYKDKSSRVYLCRCSFAQALTLESLGSIDMVQWYCAGHPQS